MKFYIKLSGLFAIALLHAAPAMAEEFFLGSAYNGVDTPFTLDADEHGKDVQFGFRGNPEKGLEKFGSPSLYVQGSVNVDGYTSWVSGGISWKIGHRFYARPGIGLAYHDRNTIRSHLVGTKHIRTDLGSSILFQPEIILGAKLTDDLSAEFAWTHISNAHILSNQNPGVDMMGLRIVIKM